MRILIAKVGGLIISEVALKDIFGILAAHSTAGLGLPQGGLLVRITSIKCLAGDGMGEEG